MGFLTFTMHSKKHKKDISFYYNNVTGFIHVDIVWSKGFCGPRICNNGRLERGEPIQNKKLTGTTLPPVCKKWWTEYLAYCEE